MRKDLKIPEGEVGSIPFRSVHTVTVPGAAAGWADTVERFGSKKVSLEDILAPAIEMGEKGFPVSELTSSFVCSFMLHSTSGAKQKLTSMIVEN